MNVIPDTLNLMLVSAPQCGHTPDISIFLEGSKNGCAPTLVIQPDGAGEVLQREKLLKNLQHHSEKTEAVITAKQPSTKAFVEQRL